MYNNYKCLQSHLCKQKEEKYFVCIATMWVTILPCRISKSDNFIPVSFYLPTSMHAFCAANVLLVPELLPLLHMTLHNVPGQLVAKIFTLSMWGRAR